MKKCSRSVSLIGICVLLWVAYLFAQAPDTLWTKVYGGSGYDTSQRVQQTSDGGYVITGYTTSYGAGDRDFRLIKTDANGDTLWTKTYGGAGEEMSNWLEQTPDGGYVIIGNTRSYGAGQGDVYLVKTDGNGNTVWTKIYGGARDDAGWSVQLTSDGGYIIAASSRSFAAVSNHDFWLIKTDANGDTLWTKVYGGPGHDTPLSVQQTIDGGFFIMGCTASFGAGSNDFWFIKTDANGDSLWSKTYGGVDNDIGSAAEQTADGGYILAGDTKSFGAGDRDVWLIKTDANGDTLWTKTYGGPASDYAQAVQPTSDGGYVIVGDTKSFGPGDRDVWVIQTDANGDSLWTQTYGGANSDAGNDIEQTSDGGYIITGNTYSSGQGLSDVYLIRIAAEEVPGFICGTITDQYNGLAVPEVVMDLYTSSGDTLLTSTTTDSTGFYEFLGYPTDGDTHYLQEDEQYLVWMILPEGYCTHDFSSKTAVVSAEVDFTAYVCGGSYARGMGYWKHQVNMVLKDKVHDYTETDLLEFLDTIHDTWDYFDNVLNMEDMKNVFQANSCMADRATKHLLALELNVVSDKLYEGALIDLGELSDATTVGEAILECEGILLDSNSTDEDYERAKDIAEMLNNMEGFVGGGPQFFGTGSLATPFGLSQNYPNPFTSTTSIPYALSKGAHVTLKIYNAAGQLVNTLVDGILESGYYTTEWNRNDRFGHQAPSGIYFYRLSADEFVSVKKMTIIR